MKKLLFLMLSMLLSGNFIYAEISKQLKSDKKTTDVNKTMTNDEFMKEFMKLEQELATAKKTGKTLDEINSLLGVDKKK